MALQHYDEKNNIMILATDCNIKTKTTWPHLPYSTCSTTVRAFLAANPPMDT